jgi:hypothetical protein
MAIGSDISNGASVASDSLTSFASSVFTTQMSVQGWALIAGILICMSILWYFTLHEIHGGEI